MQQTASALVRADKSEELGGGAAPTRRPAHRVDVKKKAKREKWLNEVAESVQ